MYLGYPVEEDPALLSYAFFPDKIGGKPAWLILDQVPKLEAVKCEKCEEPMVFLLQIYSPLDHRPDCFHRMVYLFMCKNGECFGHKNYCPFIALRAQLPRKNQFFEYEPLPDDDVTTGPLADLIKSRKVSDIFAYGKLCSMCGIRADKSCSKCSNRSYCSRSHQIADWSRHKKDCQPDGDHSQDLKSKLDDFFSPNDVTLPEFRLESEKEVLFDNDEEQDFPVENSPFASSAEDDEELNALEEVARHETTQDKILERFKKLTKNHSDQVLRFQRGGQPFWFVDDDEEATSPFRPDLPPCTGCKGCLIFEFQVTPQILSSLKLDEVGKKSPDFGTVLVFTCADSCLPSSSDSPYTREHVICQYL